MKAKLVKETLADKYVKQDPYLAGVPSEHEDFKNKYAEEQQKYSKNAELFFQKGNWKLYKNPQNLNNFGKNVKGVILPNGDFFLELIGGEAIHNDILLILKDKKLIPETTKKNWGRLLPNQTKFLTVQRVSDTNSIAIGESNTIIYSKEVFDKYAFIYNEFMVKAKQKCKNIGFVNKLIGVKIEIPKNNDHIINK